MALDESDIEDAAYAAEDLAQRLGWLCDAANELLDAGLTQDAIVCLVKEKVGNRVSKTDVKTVIEALPRLREFLKKKAA